MYIEQTHIPLPYRIMDVTGMSTLQTVWGPHPQSPLVLPLPCLLGLYPSLTPHSPSSSTTLTAILVKWPAPHAAPAFTSTVVGMVTLSVSSSTAVKITAIIPGVCDAAAADSSSRGVTPPPLTYCIYPAGVVRWVVGYVSHLLVLP